MFITWQYSVYHQSWSYWDPSSSRDQLGNAEIERPSKKPLNEIFTWNNFLFTCFYLKLDRFCDTYSQLQLHVLWGNLQENIYVHSKNIWCDVWLLIAADNLCYCPGSSKEAIIIMYEVCIEDIKEISNQV